MLAVQTMQTRRRTMHEVQMTRQTCMEKQYTEYSKGRSDAHSLTTLANSPCNREVQLCASDEHCEVFTIEAAASGRQVCDSVSGRSARSCARFDRGRGQPFSESSVVRCALCEQTERNSARPGKLNNDNRPAGQLGEHTNDAVSSARAERTKQPEPSILLQILVIVIIQSHTHHN